jgi:hypothetical protein
MELFDYIKSLFDKDSYSKVRNNTKKKFSFMLLRYISIKYPLEANNMNIININEVHLSDFLHRFLVSRYTRVPNWIFTKTKKEELKKDTDISTFINFYDLDKIEVDQLKKLFPKEFEECIKEFVTYQKNQDK